MTMTPGLRRLTFTTHITSSVGWIGAVFVFLALAVIGLSSQDERTVRGAYLLMAPAAWLVLVPLAHASLLSGIVLALGTTWGLFRHYWVVLKLLITAFSTVILLIYMGTFRQMAQVAADPVVDLAAVRNASPIVHAILASILLLAATVLGVYKPFGMTAYGRRKHDERGPVSSWILKTSPVATSSVDRRGGRRAMYMYAIIAIGIMLLFLLLHFTGSRFLH
jgi:hypothetical protein